MIELIKLSVTIALLAVIWIGYLEPDVTNYRLTCRSGRLRFERKDGR